MGYLVTSKHQVEKKGALSLIRHRGVAQLASASALGADAHFDLTDFHPSTICEYHSRSANSFAGSGLWPDRNVTIACRAFTWAHKRRSASNSVSSISEGHIPRNTWTALTHRAVRRMMVPRPGTDWVSGGGIYFRGAA